MIVALVISLIFNVLFIGLALYINNSWYHDVIKLIKDFDKEYSRLNDEWAEFCNKQIKDAVNKTTAVMQEVNNNESKTK